MLFSHPTVRIAYIAMYVGSQAPMQQAGSCSELPCFYVQIPQPRPILQSSVQSSPALHSHLTFSHRIAIHLKVQHPQLGILP